MFGRHGILTDDADQMLYGCDEFGPNDGYDPMYEGPGDGPRCGGENVGCTGCRHCDPVDPELKPYGWGIERFEDPALERANAAMWAEVHKRAAGKYTSAWVETWGMYAGRGLHHAAGRPTDADRELRDLCWRYWSRQSARRRKHSGIVWDRLCAECETHRQAVERYAAWAARAVTVRYRDE